MEEEKKSHPLMIVGIIVLVLAVAGYGLFKYIRKDTTQVQTETPTETGTTPDQSSEATSLYHDGVYSSNGVYTSPGGQEQIVVKLTLEGGAIKDINVTSLATRPESKKNQQKFISGYKTLVVGKNIDDVVLDKVSGSSLTPKGFNDAIEKIKIQASAV